MFSAGWERNPPRVAPAQRCSVLEKQLPCCRARRPDSRMCDLCKASGKWHSQKTKHRDRYQMWCKNSEAKSSKRHNSYNNLIEAVLNDLVHHPSGRYHALAMLSAVTEAVDVLSHPKPIKKKVRPLQSKWNVAQKQKAKTETASRCR